MGDLLTHHENPGLGAGRVVAVTGRSIEVEFPSAGARLRLAADSAALARLDLVPGRRVRRHAGGGESVIAAVLEGGRARLADGTEAALAELWPVELDARLVERLAAGDLDPLEDFAVRLDALRLARLREADGLGSFLGGRIRLFPHQLHVAERATRTDPVRWLLADEVGLGKTVEACLILNRLVRTGRVDRCLVVAPQTLTVQWLGELWRKHHQVFVLLDEARLADVAKDFGAGFNPFDAHRRVVIALETLAKDPRLTRWAVDAGIDLLVVDEAHRLRRPRGHPGGASYRAVEPITRRGRHVLLLTATPLEDDAHGFFRLLQLLRPADFPAEEGFEERLARGVPLPACTSSTRRADVGGLPPRLPRPVAPRPEDAAGWEARRALETTLRAAPAGTPLAARAVLDRVQRSLSSGAALRAALGPGEEALGRRAEAADAADPRLAWLAAAARGWKERGDKTLVFVAHRESLEWLRTALSRLVQLATAAFHEDLSPGRRDIEVAQFRRGEGPGLLVSTECGGEGRNFEFCDRVVLFDLPWSPVVVEQRIGRLDRIGRTRDVEIVYFRPPGGMGAAVARAYESVGLFREPLAGLEPELSSLAAAFEAAALAPEATGDATEAAIAGAVAQAHAARTRVREAAYQELHRDRFRPEHGPAILARVPAGLDALDEDVVTAAAERLGFAVEPHAGRRVFSIELGNEALVDSLPGVPGGTCVLGTFDREEAVAREDLDFLAAGHPLVEGLLAHLEESPRGRVAALRVPLPAGTPDAARGLGLLALYREGLGFEAVALDAAGRRRPEWADALTGERLFARPVAADDLRGPGFAEAVRRLAGRLDPARPPVALAALFVETSSRNRAKAAIPPEA